MSEPQWVDGFYPKPKSDKAPEYVIGKLSINLEQFMPWLRQWCKDNPGENWLRIDMTTRKNDQSKGSAKLDTWKPDTSRSGAPAPAPQPENDDDALPF